MQLIFSILKVHQFCPELGVDFSLFLLMKVFVTMLLKQIDCENYEQFMNDFFFIFLQSSLIICFLNYYQKTNKQVVIK